MVPESDLTMPLQRPVHPAQLLARRGAEADRPGHQTPQEALPVSVALHAAYPRSPCPQEASAADASAFSGG